MYRIGKVHNGLNELHRNFFFLDKIERFGSQRDELGLSRSDVFPGDPGLQDVQHA